MATASTTLVTAEEFLRLPEVEGITRELIDGELRQRPMTTRNPRHSITTGRVAQVLNNWLDTRSDSEGVIAVGDARCRLSVDPDSIVGVDVGYFEGAEAVRQGEEPKLFDMAPTVAVEVLSPSDTHEDVSDKIRRYLAAGTRQVWVADPDFRTLMVYRSGASPTLYAGEQEIDGGAELPGSRVPAALLFSVKPAATP